RIDPGGELFRLTELERVQAGQRGCLVALGEERSELCSDLFVAVGREGRGRWRCREPAAGRGIDEVSDAPANPVCPKTRSLQSELEGGRLGLRTAAPANFFPRSGDGHLGAPGTRLPR